MTVIYMRLAQAMRIVAGIGALVLMVTYLPGPAAQAQQGPISVCHERLAASVEPNGALSFGADPDLQTCGPGPTSFALSFGWPSGSTSWTTVRIDGADHVYHLGTVVTPPTEFGTGIFSTMSFGGEIEVSQLVQVGLTNPTTGRPDAAQIAYTVDNVSPDQQAHDVGIRFMVDTRVGDHNNPTFFVDNTPVTTENEYVGTVPELFTVQNPDVLSQAAAGALSPNFGAVTPDRFIIGEFSTFATAWDYPSSGSAITDSAFAAYWETLALAPGNQATYAMVYGVGPGGQAGGGGDPIPGCEATEQNQCGTTGDDNLSASDGTVVGGPGDDTITLTVDDTTNTLTADGGDGADRILLNIADPTNISAVHINSGGGADRVFVPRNPGSLSPVVKTGASNDVIAINTQASSPKLTSFLQGAPVGRYSINAGGGADRVTAGTSNDLVDGAGGNDRLLGAAGFDTIEGGDGNDDMEGGDGGDVLHGGDGANDFAGGRGRDTCLSDTRRDKFNSCERVRRNHRRNHQAI
ncbi:MAG: hypothetical protein ACRDKT_09655 [Actinomycetota bacterium]